MARWKIKRGSLFGALMGLGVLALPTMVVAGLRIFTLPDGRVLEAKIVGYDDRAGLVQVERKDGKRVKVKPSVFVEEDQQYIKDWVTLHALLSEQSLHVEADSRVAKEWKEKETKDVQYSDGIVEEDFVYNVVKYENVVYDFTFKNSSVKPVKDLLLEYCIYYEQSGMTWDKNPETELKTFYGKINVAEIPVDEPVTISTKPVMIYRDEISAIPQLGGDRRCPGKGKVVGVLVHLVLKAGDLEVTRELSDPKSMDQDKHPWVEASMPNERKPFTNLYGNQNN